jgi:hypothetical protein
MAFLTRSGVDGAGSEWAKMAFLIRSGDTCWGWGVRMPFLTILGGEESEEGKVAMPHK